MLYYCHLHICTITEKDDSMPTSLPSSVLNRSAIQAGALVQMAAELGQRGVAGGMTRRRTASIALHSLAVFARKQFDFLRAGFGKEGAFESDERYPFEFLHEATVRQVTFDIDVLLRTISHRDSNSSSLEMRDTLELADRLAVNALLPAVRHGLVEPTVMLTYFQKSPTIRLIPYVPLGMIGIDLSAVGDPNRMLAIAHETGHHVYRQITINYASHLDEQIEAMASPMPETSAPSWPQWLLAWEEEIFADIYAALIAGPVAAIGLQEFILTGRRASLIEDDGDHPLDALRPQIMHTTLRIMAEKRVAENRQALLATAEALDAAWQEHLAARGTPVEFLPAGADSSIALTEAGALLRALVEEIAGSALAALVSDTEYTPWSVGGDDVSTALAESMEQFVATCEILTLESLPELTLRNNRHLVAVARYPIEASGGQRTVGEIGDPYLDELRSAGLAGQALEAEQWKAVFLAGDWTTQEGGSGIKPPVAYRPPYWWLTYRPVTPVTRPVRR
jgi:hypothetical protein